MKFFYSDMPGAPVLSGSAGALIGILDACLQDGFGAKSVTSMVVSGGVATATVGSGHAAVIGSTVLIAGSSITALNGDQVVTAVTSTTVSFATAASNGTATGTITLKMSPLGWTKAFAGSDLAAYKSAAVEATGFYLRVDNTGSTTARVVGYETMIDVDTGSHAFPTNAQVSGGMYWPQSNSADTNPRKWALFGDDRIFYIYMSPTSSVQTQGVMLAFGDIDSNKGADGYGCVIFGGDSSVSGTGSPVRGCVGYGESSNTPAQSYIARAALGLGGPVSVVRAGAHNYGPGYSGHANYSSSCYVFPDSANNGLLLSPVDLRVQTSIRGRLPGVYHTPQAVGDYFNSLDILPGTAEFAGRRMMSMRLGTPGTVSTYGAVFVDLTGPWRE